MASTTSDTSNTSSVCVCVCVCVCVKERRKDRADGMREKSAHCPRRDSNLYLWIRAHSASDCTTTAGTPRVSRMKHFRHSPVSSIAKKSCMKDCVCVCVCVRACVSVRACAVRVTGSKHSGLVMTAL